MESVSGAPHQVPFDFSAPAEPLPLPDELPPRVGQFDDLSPPAETVEDEPREAFGAWLLKQRDRKGWVGDLAKAAGNDRLFPKAGSPDDVRKRLHEQGADGDAFEALDDAEMDWACW